MISLPQCGYNTSSVRTPLKQRTNQERLDLLRTFSRDQAGDHGQRVRARRQALKLTLEQLADLVGTPAQTVSKVERGELLARPYLQHAIALALHAEPSDLFPQPTRQELLRRVVA